MEEGKGHQGAKAEERKDIGWISSPHILTSYQAIKDEHWFYLGIFSASSNSLYISILSTILPSQSTPLLHLLLGVLSTFPHPRFIWVCDFPSLSSSKHGHTHINTHFLRYGSSSLLASQSFHESWLSFKAMQRCLIRTLTQWVPCWAGW